MRYERWEIWMVLAVIVSSIAGLVYLEIQVAKNLLGCPTPVVDGIESNVIVQGAILSCSFQSQCLVYIGMDADGKQQKICE